MLDLENDSMFLPKELLKLPIIWTIPTLMIRIPFSKRKKKYKILVRIINKNNITMVCSLIHCFLPTVTCYVYMNCRRSRMGTEN